MDGDQLEFFEDLPKVEIPEWKPHTTCANCAYILAVRFQKKNLFFCRTQGKGQYGRKIKKSDPNCKGFVENDKSTIPQWDGYYGGYSDKGLRK